MGYIDSCRGSIREGLGADAVLGSGMLLKTFFEQDVYRVRTGP